MYFQTNVRKHRKSSMGLVVAVVAVLAAIGGTAFYYRIQRGQEVQALKEQTNAAVASGTRGKMSAAVKTLGESDYTADNKELADAKVLLIWMLWTDYGVKPDSGEPDPASLNAVTPSSSLALVAARAYRDFHTGNLVEGEKFLKEARKDHSREPIMAALFARFALERGLGDPNQLDEANSRYFKAMDAYQGREPDAFPISKAQILFGYARTTELLGNIQGATNNYTATLTAEQRYIWATVRNEIAKIPPEMTFEEADEAIKKMIDENEALLSPLQRSTMHIERARWALKTFNLDLAVERLQEAARMDPADFEPLLLLGTLYVQMGKIGLANERLNAAAKLAPKNVRITCAKIAAALAADKTADAEAMLNKIPEGEFEYLPAQVARIRVQMATGKLDEAEASIKAAQVKNPKAFQLKLQNAFLLMAQENEDAKSILDTLLIDARKQGMLPLAIDLQAYSATLDTSSDRSKSFEQAAGAAQANENATALVILAKALIKEDKKDEAKPLLEQAKKFGDLPQIDALLKEVG